MKIPWRRAGQPTPVFFPGEFHGQRSLAGHTPQGCKESDTTEATYHAPCTYLCPGKIESLIDLNLMTSKGLIITKLNKNC